MSDWEMILAMLGNHSRQILYQPLLNQLTGHALASLLLQQILYRWGQNGRTPFYKFTAPCRHAAYKTDDSWQEELGFSRTEFETARRRIGVKIHRGQSKSIEQVVSLVMYWTDNRRLTWYALNEALVAKKLRALVESGKLPDSGNAGILQCPSNAGTRQYLSNAGKLQYLRNAEKPHLLMRDSCISFITESPTEKTTKRENAPAISPKNLSEKQNGRKAADERSHHPAIAGWRNVASRYPGKQNWDLIIQRLGEQPDLERLQRVMTGWLGSGYRPDNVLGILDWYDRDQTRPAGVEESTAVSLAMKPDVNVGLVPTSPVVGGRF
jgi:hypothetical protein